jgi:hypothetical protein
MITPPICALIVYHALADPRAIFWPVSLDLTNHDYKSSDAGTTSIRQNAHRLRLPLQHMCVFASFLFTKKNNTLYPFLIHVSISVILPV